MESYEVTLPTASGKQTDNDYNIMLKSLQIIRRLHTLKKKRIHH